MARKKLQLAPDQVQKLAKFGASIDQIAEFYGVHRSTIFRRLQDDEDPFCDAFKKGRAGLQMSLKRKLIQQIERGNVASLIFALKNYTEMRDRRETVVEGKFSAEKIASMSRQDLEQFLERVAPGITALLRRRTEEEEGLVH